MANAISPPLVMLAMICTLPASAQEMISLAPDSPTKIGGMEAVCTGVGLEARQNPAWTAYPLKIEVAGRGGQYLGDITLTLSRDGHGLTTVHCDGPWILFRAEPGRYQVEARTEGKTATSAAFVPASGQGRIILRFPDVGGEVGPAPAAASS
jgi:hypothetical protein